MSALPAPRYVADDSDSDRLPDSDVEDSDSHSDITLDDDREEHLHFPSKPSSKMAHGHPSVNVCTTVMSKIMGIGQKTDVQKRHEIKEEQAKVSLYINFNLGYGQVKKNIVLHRESHLFNESYPNPLFCLAVLGRLLRLHSTDELQLSKDEVTNLFFRLTKLFGTSTIASPMDQCVRRMVYWLLNEITELSQPEERMMLLSCLTKDMTDPFTPALRARALRLLPNILIQPAPNDDTFEKQPLSSVVNSMDSLHNLSQAIAATKTISNTLPCSLDPTSRIVTSRVISAALVALCRLLQSDQTSQLISPEDQLALRTHCRFLATTATNNGRDFRMVQFHALHAVALFDHGSAITNASNNNNNNDNAGTSTNDDEKEKALIDKTSKEFAANADLSALVGSLIMGDAFRQASPLTMVVLIRHTEQILLQGLAQPGQKLQQKLKGTGGQQPQEEPLNPRLCATHYHFFFQACLINRSEMVICETARVVIHLAPNLIAMEVVEKAIAVLNRLKRSNKKNVKEVAERLSAQLGQTLLNSLGNVKPVTTAPLGYRSAQVPKETAHEPPMNIFIKG